MKRQYTKVPEAIWRQFAPITEMRVFAVRLRDGTVLHPIVISPEGELLGLDVGLQTGVEEFDTPIPQEAIEALRIGDGILGTFGLTRWRKR